MSPEDREALIVQVATIMHTFTSHPDYPDYDEVACGAATEYHCEAGHEHGRRGVCWACEPLAAAVVDALAFGPGMPWEPRLVLFLFNQRNAQRRRAELLEAADTHLRAAVAALDPCQGPNELYEQHEAVCVPFYEARQAALTIPVVEPTAGNPDSHEWLGGGP